MIFRTMIVQILAEAAPVPEMNVISTAAIAAVCSLISGIVLYGKGRQRRTVTIDQQPVQIDVAEKFVTKTEFAEFKGEMKAEVKEMKGLFDKAVTLIAERDERLTDKIGSQGEQLTELINKVASGAYEARRQIHHQVNAHGERIAVMSERTDVSKAIGKLGGAIMAAMKDKPKG